MCHSTSVKNIHQVERLLSNNDDEEIRAVMSSILDTIEKEIDSLEDSTRILFDISSVSSRRKSSEKQIFNTENSFQSSDDYKHSLGVLVDVDDMSTRKYLFLIFNISLLIFDNKRNSHMDQINNLYCIRE